MAGHPLLALAIDPGAWPLGSIGRHDAADPLTRVRAALASDPCPAYPDELRIDAAAAWALAHGWPEFGWNYC